MYNEGVYGITGWSGKNSLNENFKRLHFIDILTSKGSVSKMEKLKKFRALLIILTLILLIGTATLLIIDIPSVSKLPIMIDTSAMIVYWIFVVLVVIEVSCGIIGSYILMAGEKESLFLYIALILGLFYFKISKIQLSMLVLTFGITIGFGEYSIGLNLVGVLLLFLYYRLHKQTVIYQKEIREVTIEFTDENGDEYSVKSCHLDQQTVKDGQKVEAGEQIGVLGDSGTPKVQGLMFTSR